MRYWSDEIHHWNEEGHYQINPKIMVWAGIWEKEIVGRYFFCSGNVTGKRYLEFLQTFLCDYLEHVPVLRRQNLFFQEIPSQKIFSIFPWPTQAILVLFMKYSRLGHIWKYLWY